MSSYTFFLVLLKPDDSSFIPGNPELQNDLVADDKDKPGWFVSCDGSIDSVTKRAF